MHRGLIPQIQLLSCGREQILESRGSQTALDRRTDQPPVACDEYSRLRFDLDHFTLRISATAAGVTRLILPLWAGTAWNSGGDTTSRR